MKAKPNLTGAVLLRLLSISTVPYSITALALALISMALPVAGGTVITANLPDNTAIINICGTQDGAAGYNGDQSLWYHPFFTGGATQLLEYTFQPGTYTFRVIDPADAAALFPALTLSETNEIYTAWTYNTPWVNNYVAFDSAASTNFNLPQLFDGAWTNNPGFSTAGAAYGAAISGGFYNLIRTGPLGRDGTVFTNSYTFASANTLIFAVPDYALSDNAGGVSVLISPVNITVVTPLLSIIPGTDAVTLLWPTNATGFNLEQNTNLTVATWSSVANVPIVVSTNNTVTLVLDTTGTPQTFFRLRHP